MTKDTTLGLAALTIILSAWLMVLLHRDDINQWERNRGYPFGQMCKSIFTLWEDTCPKDKFSWVWEGR